MIKSLDRAKAVRLGWLVAVIVCSLVASCSSTSGTEPSGNSSDSGLTKQQRAVAVALAQREAHRVGREVTSATATAGPGTLPLEQSNTGHGCQSGTLLHITLIGTFDIPIGAQPVDPSSTPPDTAVTAEEITADPKTSDICLISVRTDAVAPAPGSTVLFGG
jgi:hypothetical protein